MPTKCYWVIHSRLTSESFTGFSIVIQSLDPTAQAPSLVLVFTCLHESGLFHLYLHVFRFRNRSENDSYKMEQRSGEEASSLKGQCRDSLWAWENKREGRLGWGIKSRLKRKWIALRFKCHVGGTGLQEKGMQCS